jgi:hypothetical protein
MARGIRRSWDFPKKKIDAIPAANAPQIAGLRIWIQSTTEL